MVKKRDRTKKVARGAARKQPRERFLVLCEGEATEPDYLRGFSAWCRNPLVEVVVPREHGVPLTLVERAVERQNLAEKTAKKEKDANLQFDRVWCVFDVDEHPNLNDAIQKARSGGINLAVSNPCFELWVLLHFREQPGARHHSKLRALLGAHIPGYDKHLDFKVLESGYFEAVKRAERLVREARSVGEDSRNPTTTMHHLTEEIRLGTRSAEAP